MSAFAKQLIGIPQREEAGADSASRYHYQALCGLVLIFEAHRTGRDYALVFEFHDDIALLDSRLTPTEISFFQVKTKERGHWTIGDLVRQKPSAKKGASKTKLPSIIGKMYANIINFGDAVAGAFFLSNASVALGPENENFSLAECSPDDAKKAVAQILSEHPGQSSVRTDLVRFRRVDLSLPDPDTHAKGKLNQFIVDQLGDVEFSLEVLYRAIVDECTRKSRSKTRGSTLEEMLERKGITRLNADCWLASLRARIQCPSWEAIAPELAYPALEKAPMAREWSRYVIEVLDANAAVGTVRGEISRHLDDPACSSMRMMQLIEYVYPQVAVFASERLRPINTQRIKVMIIYEAYAKSQT